MMKTAYRRLKMLDDAWGLVLTEFTAEDGIKKGAKITRLPVTKNDNETDLHDIEIIYVGDDYAFAKIVREDKDEAAPEAA